VVRCVCLVVALALLAIAAIEGRGRAESGPLGTSQPATEVSRAAPAASAQFVSTPAVDYEERDVVEPVTVHIDGPLLGPRDVEESVTKRIRVVRPAPAPVAYYSPPVPVAAYNPYGGGSPYPPPVAMPSFQPAPFQSNYGSFAGGVCGPSG
jgi:hypothetical protein